MSTRMLPRPLAIVAVALFVVCGTVAQAFTPHTDHSIMNASSGVVVLDIQSSVQRIGHFRAPPGGGVTFNGVFRHLTIRMADGKVLSVNTQRLQQLHGDTMATNGAWLVDDSGIRAVTTRQYLLAYRRFHKLWP